MIYCYQISCKYCNDKYSINTVYRGYQELLKCESYEESKFSKDMKKFLDSIKE